MPESLHSCLNCGHTFAGKFCNHCGEKVYDEHDKQIPHLLEDGFHFVTHFEGKFFNTLGAVVKRPGKLSLEYCKGLRKKYFKPISFFLMLVILYLMFPFFEGLNMKLYYHVRHDWYGEWAMEKAVDLMKAKGLSDAEMGEAFHQKGEKTSKFLLFLMIPFMGLVSWILAYRKRRLYFDHFIFSTEISAFFILFGFLLLPLILGVSRLIGWPRQESPEWQIGLIILSACLIYLVIASRRFFNFKWLYSVIYSILCLAALGFFVQVIYKFILFVVTINLL